MADLHQRAAEAKQALLLSLRHANEAVLDGSHDATDLACLNAALDQARLARDRLETLRQRLDFHLQLQHLATAGQSEDPAHAVVALVRLGVEGGYQPAEARALAEAALRPAR